MNLNSSSIIDYELKEFNGIEVYICKYIRSKFNDIEWDEFLSYDDELVLSIKPKEPLAPRELKKKWFSEESVEVESERWLVITKKEKKIIGRAFLAFYNENSALFKDNQFTAETYIDLHPEYRRNGIGTYLLKLVVQKSEQRKIAKFHSEYILECSGEYLKKYGFKIASERNLSKLFFTDIDWDKMNSWCNNLAKEDGCSIHFFETVPDDILEEFCNVYTSCGKMAPDYDGDYTACEQHTPESKRRNEARCKEDGIIEITAIVKENDGKISAVTEVAFYKENPTSIYQELTGVLEEFRKRGIGKWLKAAMTLHLKKYYPEAVYIETGNNNNNHAMLAINNQMGFKAVNAHYLVTGKLEEVKEKLSEKCQIDHSI
ncbi:MAG: GNAT family N-acetyltransferase [Candidatus Delongbacteria bacterium]|nr:GNAT family N-acetyltransferase [Candidatus Delongbacteria bacterium]MBN2835001.1 GNAT family N-acetyltransferase [Candidatus Delongbacteria bacterium]